MAWNNPGFSAREYSCRIPVLPLIATLPWLIKAQGWASHCSVARGQFLQELSGAAWQGQLGQLRACGGSQVLLHLPQHQGSSCPSSWAAWEHLGCLGAPGSTWSLRVLSRPRLPWLVLIPLQGWDTSFGAAATFLLLCPNFGWKVSALTSKAPPGRGGSGTVTSHLLRGTFGKFSFL